MACAQKRSTRSKISAPRLLSLGINEAVHATTTNDLSEISGILHHQLSSAITGMFYPLPWSVMRADAQRALYPPYAATLSPHTVTLTTYEDDEDSPETITSPQERLRPKTSGMLERALTSTGISFVTTTECKLLSLEARNITFGIRDSKEVREGLDLFESTARI